MSADADGAAYGPTDQARRARVMSSISPLCCLLIHQFVVQEATIDLRTAAVRQELKDMWRVCQALAVNPLVDPQRPINGPVMSVMFDVLMDAGRAQVCYIFLLYEARIRFFFCLYMGPVRACARV
jgi:hypothetical protein